MRAIFAVPFAAIAGWSVSCATIGTLVFGCVSSGHSAEFSLPHSEPESQGVSSAAVLSFVEAADRLDSMNGFMLVRHGHIVSQGWWAPYEPGTKREIYSLSKSFISTACGMAIAEGKLGIDDEVFKVFPNDAPNEPSENLKAMRVRDLLCMSTGQEGGVSVDADKVSAKLFMANEVSHKPGTYFLYNNSAAFMLSAILQKQTGQTALEYLRPRLFEPLGIVEPMWKTNFEGISLGAYGLALLMEDLAKFGQLYLQRGKWEGKQLIPDTWVDAAIGRQTSNGSDPKNDFEQGYGYLFWIGRHGARFGAGWGGQCCILLPKQDAVIAITAGVRDIQAILNLMWDNLLPGLQQHRLRSDPKIRKKLAAKIASLALATPKGADTSPILDNACRKFVFPGNDQKLESISLERSGMALTLVTRSGAVENRLPLGFGKWSKGRGSLFALVNAPGNTDQLLATSAAWATDDTLVVRVCAYETPFYLTFNLRFEKERLIRNWEPNMGFNDVKKSELIGHGEYQ
jgi:CubicO group peptidase (beta-lactamase class C family)